MRAQRCIRSAANKKLTFDAHEVHENHRTFVTYCEFVSVYLKNIYVCIANKSLVNTQTINTLSKFTENDIKNIHTRTHTPARRITMKT